MTIRERIQQVQERIAWHCARAGRSPADVRLIAVSKTNPAAALVEAADAGLREFGENRVEEASSKIPLVNQAQAGLTWHMIGHVQSRKAREVVPLFAVVQSVDSLKLASKLAASASEAGRILDVLLEVNVSGEAAKYGLSGYNWSTDAVVRQQLWQEIAAVAALPALRLRGLMTMAPLVHDPEETRPVFHQLAALRAALVSELGLLLPDLSMGMTDDYGIAIEEGATLIRVGRAIFGERKG